MSLLEVSSQGNATALAVGRAASQATFEHLRNPTIDPVRGTAKFGLTIKSGVKIRPGAVIVVRAGNSYVEAEYIGSNLHLWHVKAVLQRSTAARPDKPPKRIDEIVEGPLEIAVRASEASSVGDTWELKSGMKDVKLRVKTECAESKEKKAEVSASAVVKIDS